MTEKEWTQKLMSLKREERQLNKRQDEITADIHECLTSIALIQTRQFRAGQEITVNEYTPPDIKAEITKRKGRKA